MSKFLWGVATAACQYEAGLDNDWTVFASTPACVDQMKWVGNAGIPPATLKPVPPYVALRHDDPFAFRQEIERARALRLNAYRLSLEWSRLEPARGVYRDDILTSLYIPVLRQMRATGIEPVLTLHHITNPRWVLTPPETRGQFATSSMVEDARFWASLKGWESVETVDAFVAFVDHVVERIVAEMGVDAPRWWITLNEPIGSMVGASYLAGMWSPGFFNDAGKARAVYGNVLKAHVGAYWKIKRWQPNAMVSVAQNMPFSLAYDPSSQDDRAAAVQADYFYAWHSLNAWHWGTFDPAFQPDPAKRLSKPAGEFFGIHNPLDWKSTLDFVGVNYYRSWWVKKDLLVGGPLEFIGGRPYASKNDGIESAHVNDLKWRVDPGALLSTLLRIQADYGLPVLLTENGMPDAEDLQRPAYLVSHAGILERARIDGVDVQGYLHWSITDNWEWQEAYLPEARFGLYRVDREQRDASGDQTLPRRLNESAIALACLASGMSQTEAVARFGTFSDDGTDHVAPTASALRCWNSDSSDGTRWRLMLTTPGPDLPPIGWLWDSQNCRWCAFEEVAGSVSANLTGIQRNDADPARRVVTLEAQDGELVGNVVVGDSQKPLRLTLDGMTGTWRGAAGTLVILPLGEFEKATPRAALPTQPNTPYVGRWLSALPGGVAANWRPITVQQVAGSTITLIIGTALGSLQLANTTLSGTFVPIGPILGGNPPTGVVVFNRAEDGLESRGIAQVVPLLLQ